MGKTRRKKSNKNVIRALYGGVRMSWWKVILFAVATAALTSVFLLVPEFRHTSFYNMGVTYEAWVFFAVIIMANCKSPLESAAKTFVFFLVSQPLIYLFQVPFSDMGWGLFGYYKTWFFITLATFPVAFIGWYIKKKKWYSLLILLPVMTYLMVVSVTSFRDTFTHFPSYIVTAVFCLAQVIIYLYVFTDSLPKKAVGFLVPLAVAVAFLIFVPTVDVTANVFLPDNPVLTENAVVETQEVPVAEIAITSTGEDSLISVHAENYGTGGFTIRDGEKEYNYTVEIYEDDNGSPQIKIDPA